MYYMQSLSKLPVGHREIFYAGSTMLTYAVQITENKQEEITARTADSAIISSVIRWGALYTLLTGS